MKTLKIMFPTGAVCTMAALLLGGCASTQPGGQSTDDSIEQILEQAATPAPVSENTTALLVPAAPAEPPVPEERFDLEVKDAPIKDVLMGLVAQSEWNLVVHPDVGGRVTLDLGQVTVPDVLEVLQAIHDIDVERTSAGFIVRPAGLRTRIYEIDYLSLSRSGFSKTRVSSGQSTDLPPGLLGGGLGGGLGMASQNSNGDGEDDNVSTRIRTENESSFWSELTEALTAIVGNGGESDTGRTRRVIANAQAGVVSVTAMPSEHEAVREFLDVVQDSVRRQVILEARIIEVELRDEFRSGVNWQALLDIGGVDFGFGPIGGENLFDDEVAATAGRLLQLAPGSPLPELESSAFGGPFTLAAASSDFTAFIELLELQGQTRVLSSPRIATTNNQKAVIKVGNDEFFVTGVQSQTSAGSAAATTASTVQLTPFFSGIALDVTPQISREGEVILHIHPTVSSVTDQIKSFTTGGREERLPLAFSSVRESDSIVRAQSGQLVVLGGLMRDESTNERIGTPGASRVPLLGRLFGSRNEISRKTELIILIRPTVVDSDAVWQRAAAERLERLRSMRGD